MSDADRIFRSHVPSMGPATDSETMDREGQPTLATDIVMADAPLDLAVAYLAVVKERRQGHITLAQVTLRLVDRR